MKVSVEEWLLLITSLFGCRRVTAFVLRPPTSLDLEVSFRSRTMCLGFFFFAGCCDASPSAKLLTEVYSEGIVFPEVYLEETGSLLLLANFGWNLDVVQNGRRFALKRGGCLLSRLCLRRFADLSLLLEEGSTVES